MKKLLFLLVASGIALGILYAVFALFIRSPDKADNQPGETNPPASYRTGSDNTPREDTRTIPVRTANGNKIPVRDFRKDMLVEMFEGSNYKHYILRDTDSPSTAMYEILYAEEDGGFIVSLRQEPLRDTRLRAEMALVRHLGVSHEKLCDLALSVVVARDVSETYAGRQLGISNCPGSQPL